MSDTSRDFLPSSELLKSSNNWKHKKELNIFIQKKHARAKFKHL